MLLRPSLVGAVVALLAAPSAAVAFTDDPPAFTQDLKKCYVSATPDQREPIEIKATNFMPLALVNVYLDEVLVATPPNTNPPQADANGNLEGRVSAPYIATGQRVFTLRLAEQANEKSAVARSAKVTALSVTSSPTRPRNTSTRVRFRGRGFTDRLTPIYAHYVFNGHEKQTVRIGKPFGDCGQFSVRRRQFPFKNPRVGTWTVQFDQEQAYNPQALVFTRLKIVVSRKPGSRS
jgi:hypothetical protein